MHLSPSFSNSSLYVNIDLLVFGLHLKVLILFGYKTVWPGGNCFSSHGCWLQCPNSQISFKETKFLIITKLININYYINIICKAAVITLTIQTTTFCLIVDLASANLKPLS